MGTRWLPGSVPLHLRNYPQPLSFPRGCTTPPGSAGKKPTARKALPPQAEPENLPARQPLTGLQFVLTGTLPHYSHEAAKKLIEDAGGGVTDSVTKKTDYALAGADPGSKLEKARSLGIAAIDETEFLGLIK
ncbi:MAG: BRCT domain-containing protein [Terriglobia bacterium]